MLKDFRESFAADLRDPDFQRELVTIAYEEDGTAGVLQALREIANAEQRPLKQVTETDSLPTVGNDSYDFQTVRDALNDLDLDLAIVRKS
jgi:hypothetical protein